MVGAGIIGVSAAALLAEAGVDVALFERDVVAAAASGRNSGALQHPFDAPLAELHAESLAIYRALNAADGFRLAGDPVGLLLLGSDSEAVAISQRSIAAQAPELAPTLLAADELHALEPALAEALVACRLETGYPVAPAAATLALAQRARRAGARVVEQCGEVELALAGSRVAGLRLADGRGVAADRVLVAAGPWSPMLVPGWRERPPIRPVWGVVVNVELPEPPRHVLEELGIDRGAGHAPELFSLVTAGAASSVGSTFLEEEPDAAARLPAILQRAQRFVPRLTTAVPGALRVCARPVAFDGRPLIGPLDIDALFVAAGHGPWGISTGPASARLVVDQILGASEVRPEFDPRRWTY